MFDRPGSRPYRHPSIRLMLHLQRCTRNEYARQLNDHGGRRGAPRSTVGAYQLFQYISGKNACIADNFYGILVLIPAIRQYSRGILSKNDTVIEYNGYLRDNYGLCIRVLGGISAGQGGGTC